MFFLECGKQKRELKKSGGNHQCKRETMGGGKGEVMGNEFNQTML